MNPQGMEDALAARMATRVSAWFRYCWACGSRIATGTAAGCDCGSVLTCPVCGTIFQPLDPHPGEEALHMAPTGSMPAQTISIDEMTEDALRTAVKHFLAWTPPPLEWWQLPVVQKAWQSIREQP